MQFDHERYFTDKGISLFEFKFEFELILFVLPRWSKLQSKQCIHGIQRIQHKVNNKNGYSILIAKTNTGIVGTVHWGICKYWNVAGSGCRNKHNLEETAALRGNSLIQLVAFKL